MGRAFEIVATCLQCGGCGCGRSRCSLAALTIFALDCAAESSILCGLQTITTHMIVTMGLVRTAMANLASECSTTIGVSLDLSVATSEIGASRFLVAAITSTARALSTSIIVAHMLQVANTTRETFTSFFFFTAIPNLANSTATTIHAVYLDEVGWAREIVATCLQSGGCCRCGGGRGCRGCRGRGGRCGSCGRSCSLAALAIFALNVTTESSILCWL